MPETVSGPLAQEGRNGAQLVSELALNTNAQELATGLVIQGRSSADLRAIAEWLRHLAELCEAEADQPAHDQARAQEFDVREDEMEDGDTEGWPGD